MKAWLITWEWSGQRAAKPDKVVLLLNPRTSSEVVKRIVESIYMKEEAHVEDMLSYATMKNPNPYPARFISVEVNGSYAPHQGLIECGHNPYLFARKVDNVEIVKDGEGGKKLKCQEVIRHKNVEI